MCNSRNFAVSGDALIAGYGFTAEPDWLYVLDRKTGAVVQKLRLASGPEYVIARGDRVFVRCYNTDYVFKLTR